MAAADPWTSDLVVDRKATAVAVRKGPAVAAHTIAGAGVGRAMAPGAATARKLGTAVQQRSG